MDPLLLAAAALAVALLALDHTAVAQLMCSQPLVGGWLLGLLLGDPMGGLTAGALLQLLCLTELPVGASIPPDGSLAGLTGAALYLTAPRPPHWSDAAMLGLALVLFFPVAWIGRQLELVIRRANRVWTLVAVGRARQGRTGGLQLACLGGLLFFFAKGLLVALFVLGVTGAWLDAAAPWTAHLAGPLEALVRLVPCAALGVVASRYRRQGAVAAVVAGFLAGAVSAWGW